MTKENIPEFTVTTLSQSIRNTLETEFEYVRVKGELGKVSRPASGHVYFDLKDDKSILASVVWRGTKLTKRDLIEEGNEVVLVGRISSFSGHSKYQIIVEDIQAAGIGALLAMLNKRREKLAAEGIFSEKRKLALPTYPLSIGVITSISGAVIKDILNRVEISSSESIRPRRSKASRNWFGSNALLPLASAILRNSNFNSASCLSLNTRTNFSFDILLHLPSLKKTFPFALSVLFLYFTIPAVPDNRHHHHPTKCYYCCCSWI